MDIEEATSKWGHLIDKQKQTLAKAKLRKGEKPKDQKSKTEVYNQFTMNLMMTNLKSNLNTGHQEDLIHSSFVPLAYRPCIKSLHELEQISIKQLQLETQHRGTCLFLRSMTPPWRMTAIMAVMEDQHGDAIQIQLYQHEDEKVRKAVEIVDVGTIMIVKEPYFKVMGDGGYGLRVDHLSDVVILKETDERVPDVWKPRLIELDRTAEWFKLKGNKAVGENRYWDAIKHYSNALTRPTTTSEAETIKRNRSLAYLKTKQFDAALADTGYPAFGTNEKTPQKALFRAAEALYYLRKFDKALKVLHLLCTTYPENKEAKLSLDRCQMRVQERKTGSYNFKQLQAQAKKLQPPYLDHATYIGPIEIRKTETRGRGMFVTKAVKAGDILLCEKAFTIAYSDTENPKMSILIYPEYDRVSMGTHAELIKLVVHKLQRNPSLAPEFTKLCHGSYEALDTQLADSLPIVDTFLATQIMSLNQFGCPSSSLLSYRNIMTINKDFDKDFEKKHQSCGIWTQASYINHCCTSTARRSFIGDMMVVRATCDMEIGTEVTFWYHMPFGTTVKELEKKMNHWGFICDCAICKDGRATSAAIMTERKSILQQLKPFFNMTGRVKVNKIAQLLENLDKTYSKPATEVPRLNLWDPSLALAQKYGKQQKPDKVIEWTVKAMESLGFVVNGGDSSSQMFEIVKWGLVVDHLVVALLTARDAFMGIGAVEKAGRAESYAKLVYKIVVGEDSTFDDMYG